MKYKIFSVPVHHGGPFEAELNSFLGGHKIVHVRTDFLGDGENSCYSFLVEYFGPEMSGKEQKKRNQIDYREVLEPEQFAVYVRLRDERKKLAEQHGLPVFAVFTNEQLAEIVRQKPTNLEGLAEIPGVGKSKCEKFGENMLGVLCPRDGKTDNETPQQFL